MLDKEIEAMVQGLTLRENKTPLLHIAKEDVLSLIRKSQLDVLERLTQFTVDRKYLPEFNFNEPVTFDRYIHFDNLQKYIDKLKAELQEGR